MNYITIEITVGELIEQLKVYDQELSVDFGGLDFYLLLARTSRS